VPGEAVAAPEDRPDIPNNKASDRNLEGCMVEPKAVAGNTVHVGQKMHTATKIMMGLSSKPMTPRMKARACASTTLARHTIHGTFL
jgi:hypothetical protein